MEMWICIVALVGLASTVFTDIREKKIWIPIVFIFTVILFAMKYYAGEGNVSLWIASIGIGGFFYLVSIVTQGKIGKGDAFIFCMTGVGLGLWNNLILIYTSFLFAFVGAAYLLVIRRKEKHYAMPFAPYVFMAYVIMSARI